MKTFIVPTIFIAAASLFMMIIAPWWIVAVVGFVVAMAMMDSPAKAFFSGLLGVALIWIVMAVAKDSGTTISVAETLGDVVGGVPAFLMILITGLTGGAVGGLGAMSGAYARLLLLKK